MIVSTDPQLGHARLIPRLRFLRVGDFLLSMTWLGAFRSAFRAGAGDVAGEVVLANLARTSLRTVVTPPQYGCRKSHGDDKEPDGNLNSPERCSDLAWQSKAKKSMSKFSPRHFLHDDLPLRIEATTCSTWINPLEVSETDPTERYSDNSWTTRRHVT